MKVGLLLKPNKPEAVEIARDLCALIAEHKSEAFVVEERVDARTVSTIGGRSAAKEKLADTIDLLVVLGGDGTLLHGAGLVSDRKIPILGVNLGNLGFLTSCPPDRARGMLSKALRGELKSEPRMRLRVEVMRKSGERVVHFGCNDAVLSQGALARLLEFEALLDSRLITTYRADGLIIATPTGSTAYNLAAGGPILSPELQAMVLTPICPHTLTNRPLVVPATSKISVRLVQASTNVVLTVDGQRGIEIEQGAVVEVATADQPMLLHRPPNTTYFDILREKLHWGARVG